MKYIKLFEDLSINKDGYERITSDDFHEYSMGSLEMDKSEVDKIKKMPPLSDYVVKYSTHHRYIGMESFDPDCTIAIYKLDDDWYLLGYYQWNHGNSINRQFRCDRLDGLLACLKNECDFL